MRTKILEIWSKKTNLNEKSKEIFELFKIKNISENTIAITTKNELLSKIESKINEELEEMRKKHNQDSLDMKYYENPQFKGIDSKNISETNRQIGILRSKKIKYGENCSLMNIENKLAVKKNLYENFGIDIPLKLVIWENLDNEINLDKKIKKKKKEKKDVEEEKKEIDVFSKENVEIKENENNNDDIYMRSDMYDPTRPMINTNFMETNFDAPKKLTFSRVVNVNDY